MKENAIDISIIIPFFNNEIKIARCINSIIDQLNKHVELILVNDGSEDKSREITNNLCNNKINYQIIDCEHKGVCKARLAGISKAQGKYISFIDADDYVSKDYLQNLFNVLHMHNDVDMICFKYNKLNKSKQHPIFNIKEGYFDSNKLKDLINKNIFVESFFSGISLNTGNILVKKELLKKHFCYDDKITYGEDTAFAYECLIYANNIFISDKTLYYYDNCTDYNKFNDNLFPKYLLLCEYLIKHLCGKYKIIDKRLSYIILKDMMILAGQNKNLFINYKKNIISLARKCHTNNLFSYKEKVGILLLKTGCAKTLCNIAVLYN